jgi:hypothetical protein
MHIVCKPRDETLTIKIADGRVFKVTLRNGEAHVPDHVGKYLIEKGYVVAGSAPNPKPEFERVAGGGWGALLDMFDPWCKELTSQPTEGKATP